MGARQGVTGGGQQWRRFVVRVMMVAGLAGCGVFDDPVAPPPRLPSPLQPAARPRPARPPVALIRPAPRPAVPVVEPPAAAAPQVLPPLAGATAEQLEAWLGVPADRTSSGAGERWTYRSADCALDLFLFPDVASGGLTVLERRATGGSEQDCLRRVHDARAR